MDPTTLVTFLYRATPEIRTVELLGSWDNFQQPYRMHNDRRRGAGFYSGCFAFENIIFDGELHMQPTKPRSGGLKQGGTYWYYYRLNYDFEAYDDRQPHTTACPLLPGQEVNIVDVPIEILDLPSRCHSAYGDLDYAVVDNSTDQTLDPASKFALLSPPPKSKVHARCLSDDALNGRLESQTLTQLDDIESPIATPKSNDEASGCGLNGQVTLPILHEPLRRGLLASRPPSPPNDLGDLAFRPHTLQDRPDDNTYNEDNDKLPNQQAQQSQQNPQPLFSERIFSSRPRVLSTLIEDIAPNEEVNPQPISGHESDEQRSITRSTRSSHSSRIDSQTPILNLDINSSRSQSETGEHLFANPPRLYSLRNIDLQDCPSPTSPTSQWSIPSPQESDQTTPGFELPGFNFPEPDLDLVNSAMVNDDTIHDISDRLRALSDDDAAAAVAAANDDDDDNDDGAASTSASAALNPFHDANENRNTNQQFHRPRGAIWTYSLPSNVTDSNHSLAKTLSAHSHASGGTARRHIAAAPPRLDLPTSAPSGATFWSSTLDSHAAAAAHSREDYSTSSESIGIGIGIGIGLGGGGSGEFGERSITEAIFHELGYLGESIA